MNIEANSYLAAAEPAFITRHAARHQQAIQRCAGKLRSTMPVIGLRNPKIGTAANPLGLLRAL